MKQYSRRMVSGLLLVVGGLFVALILPEIVPAAVVALIPVGVALVVGGGALATSAGRVQAEIDALPPHILERQISPERLIANAIFVVGLIAFAAMGMCLLSSLTLWPLLVVFGAVGLIGGVAALLLFYRDQASVAAEDTQSVSSTPPPNDSSSSCNRVKVMRELQTVLESAPEPELVISSSRWNPLSPPFLTNQFRLPPLSASPVRSASSPNLARLVNRKISSS